MTKKKTGLKVKPKEKGFGFHKYRYAKAHREFLDYDPEFIRRLKKKDPEAYEFLKRFMDNSLTNFWHKDGKDFYFPNDKSRKMIQNEVYHRRVDIYGLDTFTRLDDEMDEGSPGHDYISPSYDRNLVEDALIAAIDAGKKERD